MDVGCNASLWVVTWHQVPCPTDRIGIRAAGNLQYWTALTERCQIMLSTISAQSNIVREIGWSLQFGKKSSATDHRSDLDVHD